MARVVVLSLLVAGAAAFSAPVGRTKVSPGVLSTDLRTFFGDYAQLAPQHVDKVLAICDDEMIGNVQTLAIARDAGLLPDFFKPVVCIGIELGLGFEVESPLAKLAASVAAPPAGGAATDDRVALGANPAGALPVAVPLNLFEVEPYHSREHLPINLFKQKKPLMGSLVSAKRIVGAEAPGEVCHIRIGTDGEFPYYEGQSAGVIPPGTNPKNGKPNAVRLYSIASTRYGDDLDGKSVSLCVRRATYWCPELKAEDPAKKGVCSNYLCDASPGTPVALTGPTGKVMLIPEVTPSADLIMVATGTGIAPYRGFIRRLFVEKTPAADAFTGLAWLFLGVSTTESLLYDDDWQQIAAANPDHFRVSYAISREQTAADGGKMYVQRRMQEHAEELFERLDGGAHIYFCGLKGMMPGILEMLEGVATSKGLSWEDRLAKLKANHQWHVEVY